MLTKEELSQPAVPPPVDENGWPTTSQTGFNKLEEAALRMGAAILNMPEKWEGTYSTKKNDDPKSSARKFDPDGFASAALICAKAILKACKEDLEKMDT